MKKFAGKVVIVTGASSGIGRATALEFASMGACVALAARRAEILNDIKEKMPPPADNFLSVRTDVTDEASVKALFDAVIEKWGRIDIVINNAGIGFQGDVVNMSAKEWDSVIATNLTSVFLCTREALRHMAKTGGGGTIVNVSSIAGLYSRRLFSAYSASKHGVTGFGRAVRGEAKDLGIRLSTVHPGRTETQFFDVYDKQPSRAQLLPARDMARYIVAIASGSLIWRLFIFSRNLMKRGFIAIQRHQP